MTNEQLKALVTRAVSLDRQIALDTDELKSLKAKLAAEAKARTDAATATEGGGKSIAFEGADGCIARVTKAGRKLLSSLKPAAKNFAKIKAQCAGHFTRLFETEIVYKPVPEFRKQATEALGAENAAVLIKLCTSSGDTSVSFETKEASE